MEISRDSYDCYPICNPPDEIRRFRGCHNSPRNPRESRTSRLPVAQPSLALGMTHRELEAFEEAFEHPERAAARKLVR